MQKNIAKQKISLMIVPTAQVPQLEAMPVMQASMLKK